MEYGLSKHEEVDLPDDFVEASKRIYQAPREPEGLLTAAELQFLGDQSADVYKEELAFYEALEANGEVYHMSNHPRDLGFGPGGAPTQEARLQNEKEFWARHAAGLEDEE